MAHENFLRRVYATGNTMTEQYKYAEQQLINDSFDYASNVETVIHINSITYVETNVSVMLDVLYRAKNNSSIATDDYRKLIFKNLDYTVNLGDQFRFGGFTWTVIDIQDLLTINNSVIVRRCNHTIKFYDSNHILTDIKAIVSNKLETLEEDRFVIVPDNIARVIVPYNSKSQEIKVSPVNTRLLINSNPFYVESIDSATNIKEGIGYLEILLKSDKIDEINDDLTNGIAYNGYLPSYALEILNGASATISSTPTQTLQLNIKLTDNDVVISATPTSFVSSNTDVCTVDYCGLISPVAVGVATITASYLTASDSISMTISTGDQHNYSVDITGDVVVKLGNSKNYSCVFRDNGITIVETTTWSIKSDSGGVTTLATITSSDNDSCTIKANTNNDVGFIRLYAKNADESITGYLRIEVKTKFG
jgi:hypothetical protein